MQTNEFIVAKIDRFQARSGMSDRQLGMTVANDHRLVRRIRDGKATLRSIAEIEEFIDRHGEGEAA